MQLRASQIKMEKTADHPLVRDLGILIKNKEENTPISNELIKSIDKELDALLNIKYEDNEKHDFFRKLKKIFSETIDSYNDTNVNPNVQNKCNDKFAELNKNYLLLLQFPDTLLIPSSSVEENQEFIQPTIRPPKFREKSELDLPLHFKRAGFANTLVKLVSKKNDNENVATQIVAVELEFASVAEILNIEDEKFKRMYAQLNFLFDEVKKSDDADSWEKLSCYLLYFRLMHLIVRLDFLYAKFEEVDFTYEKVETLDKAKYLHALKAYNDDLRKQLLITEKKLQINPTLTKEPDWLERTDALARGGESISFLTEHLIKNNLIIEDNANNFSSLGPICSDLDKAKSNKAALALATCAAIAEVAIIGLIALSIISLPLSPPLTALALIGVVGLTLCLGAYNYGKLQEKPSSHSYLAVIQKQGFYALKNHSGKFNEDYPPFRYLGTLI